MPNDPMQELLKALHALIEANKDAQYRIAVVSAALGSLYANLAVQQSDPVAALDILLAQPLGAVETSDSNPYALKALDDLRTAAEAALNDLMSR